MNANKVNQLLLGSSACASIVVPQAITKTWPQLFGSIAPLAANTLPYCTGVCGSCGGTCIGSVGVIAFLAFLKQRRKNYEPS